MPIARRGAATVNHNTAEFELVLPEPLYQQKEIGVFMGKSNLETLLEKAQVRYEDFILWCEATKVRTDPLL